MNDKEYESVSAYLQHPQAENLINFLKLKTRDEYPATLDGVKAAMDISFLAGRRSLVKEIEKLREEGQK